MKSAVKRLVLRLYVWRLLSLSTTQRIINAMGLNQS
jgi:hypothetical protein